MPRKRVHLFFSGHVQGVGFRYTAKSVALEFEVTGGVRNLRDGRVELIAEGEEAELQRYLGALQDSGLGGLIRHTETHWSEPTGEFRGFTIMH